MGSKGTKGKQGSEQKQWIFPNKNPPEQVIKHMIGMIAEIAIRTLWENYSYKFGGKYTYRVRGDP